MYNFLSICCILWMSCIHLVYPQAFIEYFLASFTYFAYPVPRVEFQWNIKANLHVVVALLHWEYNVNDFNC